MVLYRWIACCVSDSIANPHHFNADPDHAFHCINTGMFSLFADRIRPVLPSCQQTAYLMAVTSGKGNKLLTQKWHVQIPNKPRSPRPKTELICHLPNPSPVSLQSIFKSLIISLLFLELCSPSLRCTKENRSYSIPWPRQCLNRNFVQSLVIKILDLNPGSYNSAENVWINIFQPEIATLESRYLIFQEIFYFLNRILLRLFRCSHCRRRWGSSACRWRMFSSTLKGWCPGRNRDMIYVLAWLIMKTMKISFSSQSNKVFKVKKSSSLPISRDNRYLCLVYVPYLFWSIFRIYTLHAYLVSIDTRRVVETIKRCNFLRHKILRFLILIYQSCY
jgi:hypothetical protein